MISIQGIRAVLIDESGTALVTAAVLEVRMGSAAVKWRPLTDRFGPRVGQNAVQLALFRGIASTSCATVIYPSMSLTSLLLQPAVSLSVMG